jgi:hypothetical protein
MRSNAVRAWARRIIRHTRTPQHQPTTSVIRQMKFPPPLLPLVTAFHFGDTAILTRHLGSGCLTWLRESGATERR